MSIKDTPCTRLRGIQDFLYKGLVGGEIDVGTTVVELITLVSELQNGKNAHLEKKLKGVEYDYR